MQAKLSQLAEYLGERIDSTTEKQAYMAYSIARIKVLNILYEIIDKQLEGSLGDECV